MLEESQFSFLGKIAFYYLASRGFWTFLSLLKEYVLASAYNFKKCGDWTVVTGATDGIGLSFARKLAKQGQNIVLISRNPEKLETVAKQLESEFNVTTKCIAVDFSQTDIYEKIEKGIAGLNVGVLINNVGFSYSYPEYLMEIEDLPNMMDKMLAINVQSALHMTRLVLPAFEKKRTGVILNISSASACKPVPLLTLYSASKQFVSCFSEALQGEYESKGIVIQCVTPFFVTTKLSKIRRSSLFIPTPDTFVSAALKTVGKSASTYGYLPHAIQGLLYHSLPDAVYAYFSMSQMKAVRKKALKRKQAKKE